MLTSEGDWGVGSTRCTDMVARAASLGQTRVMLVPTLYFVDREPRNHSAPGQQGKVSYYCYSKLDGGCPPADAAGRAKFGAGMKKCAAAAVDSGLSLALAPHIDDGVPGGAQWRQGLVFDPLVKHGGGAFGGDAMSYDEFILQPLATAVAAASTAKTKVWFSTQGEMGATLVYHPASHTKLLAALRERVIAGRTAAAFPPTNVQVGVLSNADKLCSCVAQTGNGTYTDDFVRAWPTIKPQFNLPAIKALFDATDFVGISNYPSLKSPDVRPVDFEAGIKSFATELAQFGVDLRDLVTTKGKTLWFSEVGIGGGGDAGGWSRTADPAYAAANTYHGVTSTYRPETDPWHAGGAGGDGMLALQRKFYSSLASFVSSRGACANCTWAVDGAFLWNCGSWDVQAIHPASFDANGTVDFLTGAGSYADAPTVSLIADHNAGADTGVPVSAAAIAKAAAEPAGWAAAPAGAPAAAPRARRAGPAGGGAASSMSGGDADADDDAGPAAPEPTPVPTPDAVPSPLGAPNPTFRPTLLGALAGALRLPPPVAALQSVAGSLFGFEDSAGDARAEAEAVAVGGAPAPRGGA